MITRRGVIIAIGATALTAKRSLAQQRTRSWRIGFLSLSDTATIAPWLSAFNRQMQQYDYELNKDYVIEVRSGNGDLKRLDAMAAELVALKVDIFIPTGTTQTIAVTKAARDTPIIFVTVGDPIRAGIVKSLPRPGGYVTGFTNNAADLMIKKLELAQELLPKLRSIGYLFNPAVFNERADYQSLLAAANKASIKVAAANSQDKAALSTEFDKLVRDKVGAVIIAAGTNMAQRDAIADQALKHRLPTVYGFSDGVDAGGLVSYGADWSEQYRNAAGYVDKIIRGSKPGDLPVQQPTKFDLVLNMKTARELGIKIPPSVMIRATRVIE